MAIRFPFRNLEPTFYAGLLDDPVLLIHIRPTGSNLLFDCGQIHQLAKRVLTGIDTIFISQAHMDHWLGLDSFTRHLHASSKTVDLFGPPGIGDKLEHRLRAYDWNLAEDFWGSYRVHDVHPDRIVSSLLAGPQQFARETLGEHPREGQIIFENQQLQVESLTCDHRVPSLIFRITEKPAFLIDEEKLAVQKLVPGPWIRELKKRFFHQTQKQEPLLALRLGPSGPEEYLIENVAKLCSDIGKPQQSTAIGYISDVGFTTSNRRKICKLLQGVELLYCEATFLSEAKQRARDSFHLCTDDVNQLLAELRPNFFQPMHLSKSFSRRYEELYKELQPPQGTQILQIPPMSPPDRYGRKRSNDSYIGTKRGLTLPESPAILINIGTELNSAPITELLFKQWSR